MVVSWRYEWDNRPPYNVRVGYPIHTFMKRPKTTFNLNVTNISYVIKFAHQNTPTTQSPAFWGFKHEIYMGRFAVDLYGNKMS